MKKLALVVSSFALVLAAVMLTPVAATARVPGPLERPRLHATFRPMALDRSLGARGAAQTYTPPTNTVATYAYSCDGTYHVVPSPNGTGHNDIFGMSVLSPTDIWAVGVQTNSSNYDRTLAEHWNGSTWSIVPTPNPGTTHNDLNGVAAISSSDVWAVGDYWDNLIGAWLSFTMHWNGSSWTTMVWNYGFLFAVTAVASNNVWAVGTSAFLPGTSVILNYNGSSWTQAASFDGGAWDNELFSVSALNANDIWAVGEDQAINGGPAATLSEHWNGSAWSGIAAPQDTGENVMAGVVALEANHAVAVGYANFVSGVSNARGEAWDLVSGGSSSFSAEAGPGAGPNVLESVAVSGSTVSAVGFWRAGNTPRQTLAIHGTWNATSHVLTWGSVVTSASPDSANNVLFAVAAVSPSLIWATGYANNGGFDQSLFEVFCGLKLALTSSVAFPVVGRSFSVTVTAQNPNGSTFTGYQGTVRFTSTDLAATLPSDYTFVPGDNGTHTFSVVLNTSTGQTIQAFDTQTTFILASVHVYVNCAGPCGSSAGPGPGRGVKPSSSSPPAPRRPTYKLDP